MASFSDPFLQLTAGALVFLATELSVLLVVEHEGDYGWKWRFGEAEDYPELNPFVSTWKIAVFFFVAIIVAPVVVSYFIWNSLLGVISLLAFWPLLFVVSVLFSFWWIWHHIIGKDFDIRQLCLLAVTTTITLVFVYLNMSR